MIQVENLTRRYGDFTAVDDVSFTIGRGEIVGLLGHNGAGKTTIMKMLTGFLEPTAGRIRIDGLDMAARPPRRPAAHRLPAGELPALPGDDGASTTWTTRPRCTACPPAQRPAAIRRAIRSAPPWGPRRPRPSQTLSRGYRQRVGVAQAILHEPDILILDEPTNGLDPTQIQHMRDLIRELARDADGDRLHPHPAGGGGGVRPGADPARRAPGAGHAARRPRRTARACW